MIFRTATFGDSDGKPEGILGVMLDITEHKLAMEALRNSERRLADIVNLLPDATFAINLKGEITLWNRAAEQYTGFKAVDLLGKGNFEYAIPFYGERRPVLIDMALAPSLENKQLYSSLCRVEGLIVGEAYTNNIKRGTAYMIGTAAALFDSDGNVVGAIETVRDITDRKLAEEALRHSEERFRQLFEQNDDSIILFSLKNGEIIDVNPATERMYGYSKEEIISQGTDLFLEPGASVLFRNGIFTLEGVKSLDSGIITATKKDGTKRILAAQGQIIRLLNNDVAYCIFRDITKQHELEREARDAQARLIHANNAASLGMLVSGFAHEINNPNSFVMGNAAILDKIWRGVMPILADSDATAGDIRLAGFSIEELADVVPKLLKGLGEGARRINAIVENLKDFAREDMIAPHTPFDLNAVIRASSLILSHHIHSHTDNFRLELSDDLPLALGKIQQIEQVVINLIMNALQSLTERSEGVTIATRLNPVSMMMIEVTVRDEGQGMSKEVLERLTEPFFSTRLNQGGSGLGLSISETIIKGHNGELRFDSAPGMGTVAIFTLPMEQER